MVLHEGEGFVRGGTHVALQGERSQCWHGKTEAQGTGGDAPPGCPVTASFGCKGNPPPFPSHLHYHHHLTPVPAHRANWDRQAAPHGDQHHPLEGLIPEVGSTHAARPGIHVGATIDRPAGALLVQLLVLALEDLFQSLLSVGTDGCAARPACLPAGTAKWVWGGRGPPLHLQHSWVSGPTTVR